MAARTERIGDALLIQADCVAWLESLPECFRVDAVVTDPPYGIGFSYESHDDNREGWFSLMNAVIPKIKIIATFAILPSCGIDRHAWWYQNHAPDWMVVWHKGSPGHLSKVGFNCWESHVCWGRPKKQMHDYFSARCGFDDNGHPCPKPIAYSNWLVSRAAAEGQTVLDPFMGSGTTGVACANLGRKFIGIEIEPKYFDIACERIAAAYAQGRLFA